MNSAQENSPIDSRATWNRALTLAAVTLLAYWPGLNAPFIFDDLKQFGRGEIQRLWPVTPLLDDGRPIGFLSFAVNHAFTGMRPAGFRAVNIAIHLATGLLLMGLVARSLRMKGVPPQFARYADQLGFAAAFLFLLHPLATGAVTYIIQRFESLAACFCLLSLYGLAVGTQASRPNRWYALAAACGWLAMLTKPTAAVLPLVALLYDRAFPAACWREVFARRWVLHLMLGLGWIAVYCSEAALRAAGVDSGSAGFGGGISSWQYLSSQPRSLARYLQLTLWPDTLILDYGWKIVHDPRLIYGLGAAVVLLVIASVGLYFVRPRIGFLALATFVALAPTSSILPIADLTVEYRMYLALPPLLTLAVIGVWAAICRWVTDESARRKVAFTLLIFVGFPLGFRTCLRNNDYRDPLRIWRQSANFNPDNGRANYNVAGRLGHERLDEGAPYFEAALASDFWDKAAVHTTFADYLAKNGRRDEAVIHYRQALKILPKDVPVRIKLAELYLQMDERGKAREQAEAALKTDPRNAAARAILARLTEGTAP